MKRKRNKKQYGLSKKQLKGTVDYLNSQVYVITEKLRVQTDRAEKYFKRLQELKARISDIDLILKFDNYTEDEMYQISMPELRKLANEQLAETITS